jgi:hypothetical protein
MKHGADEFDLYGTHVAANHGQARTIDAGAVLRYANSTSRVNVLAEYDAQIGGAQRQLLMAGVSRVKLPGDHPWSLDAFLGWTDSDAAFSPLDGTADPLYGSRGPLAVVHLERKGNAHGTGSVSVDSFARRAFDDVTVRRSNVGLTVAYGLSNLFSVAASTWNRPSAGSVIYAEAAQPFAVPSPVPAQFTRFLNTLYQDSRAAVQLKYSNAKVVADRAALDRGIFEASLGLSDTRTACVIRDRFSCAALPPDRLELTGGLSWLMSRGRQFVGVNHNAITNPHNSADASHSSSAVTDGYILASAIGRCGSIYFGSGTTFGNGDPNKNGKTILGSLVLPIAVGSNGSASALRVEFKRRNPLVLAPTNVPVNSLNIQIVAGTPHYYGVPDVTRCRT